MDIPTNDDGLKWFGEGFDGFPKTLPDDCVEYVIYTTDEQLKTADATRSRLSEILKVANKLKKQYCKDYIWQRDSFNLKIYPQPNISDVQDLGSSHSSVKGPVRLRGRTNFGDSIADEWLVVYLLLELSKKCPDAWIRVYDTDGEFLLIEAATALPKWLNPDVAENRVWINNGHLRMIPLDASPTATQNLALQTALSIIRTKPEKLQISPFIEDEAFYRLREHPTAIKRSLHNALVTIPRKLAAVIHRNPSYISPAVEAFYLRDPVSLKPLTTKDTSTLRFPPEDFVTVSCKFTKVGYAQLQSQIFDPPPAWTAVTPRMQDPKSVLGLKISCGFEMLVCDPQNQDKPVVREISLLLEDFETTEESLPDDDEIASWPQEQDDEKWLGIDYQDLEKELSGRRSNDKSADNTEHQSRFGDVSAQENLRKMVSRFEEFLNDEDADVDGVDEDGERNSDSDVSDSSISSDGEGKDDIHDEAEFERAMNETMGMPASEIETNGLLDEARRLAIEDGEQESDMDEEEEMKRVMELMESELKGHGALDLHDGKLTKRRPDGAKKVRGTTKDNEVQPKPFFGPERPPSMAKPVVDDESADEELVDDNVGPGDGELSSDDEEFNDVDLTLAKNMLESFKGQAGMAGPAGNLMRAMGINMPRDEDDAAD